MSKTIEALKEVKVLMENKFKDATVKNPTYFKSTDINTTQHIFELTTILSNGKILEIKTYTNYIAFKGSEYKLEVSVSTGNDMKTFCKEVTRFDISKEGIVNYLSELGMKK